MTTIVLLALFGAAVAGLVLAWAICREHPKTKPQNQLHSPHTEPTPPPETTQTNQPNTQHPDKWETALNQATK